MLFPTPLDAEIACGFLTVYFRVPPPIQKELDVEGSVLVMSVLEGAGGGVVAGGQSQAQPRWSCNGGLSLKKKCAALGLSVWGDREGRALPHALEFYFFLPFSRLTAEDLGQLRTSITSCLNLVSRVVQIIQDVVPPFFVMPQQAKGG